MRRRGKFSLSNYKLFSCDMGELVPVNLTEVLPGDTIQASTSAMVRCSPLLAPVMHPVHVQLHHWYVPHRLVWSDFDDFITGGPDGLNASVHPTITFAGALSIGSLADYLGLPTGVAGLAVSALPFRGYALIWNEHYRDQDLQTALTVATASGADSTTSTTLQNRCWEKDYFTSARPWEQKGAAVTIPLGTQAPVLGIGTSGTVGSIGTNLATARESPAGATRNYASYGSFTGAGANMFMKLSSGVGASTYPDIYADLSAVTGISVSTLREAFSLQKMAENRARYGSRYTEYLAFLGVTGLDARVQRPEYLGGGRQTIQFSEVLQTAEGTDPVGSMKGHGLGAMRSNRFRRYIPEHGFIYTFMSVLPKTMYYQGVTKHWTRAVKEDYWQPELEHIGQDEILNREIYAAHASPLNTFGWADRYQEYRTAPSTIAGEFRDTNLNFWHMARDFGAAPSLNSAFVSAVPTERTFAVPSKDVLHVMAKNSIQARRLVSQSGAPKGL